MSENRAASNQQGVQATESTAPSLSLRAGDQDVLDRIGMVLRVGVLASALILLFGGVIYLMRHGTEDAPDRRRFLPPEFARPAEVVDAALQWRGRALIQLGVMLLIATPVLRVGYSLCAFARSRDFVYVFFSLAVLVILLVGFFFAPARR